MIETRKTRRRGRAARNAGRGFTLLEIMVVLAIIGLIAGSVGVLVFNRYKAAQRKTAKTRITEIANSAMQYMMDNNSNCPASLDVLVQQKYLKKGVKDPWGRDFIFTCPGEHDADGVDVASGGPDKQDGTADDVSSWED